MTNPRLLALRNSAVVLIQFSRRPLVFLAALLLIAVAAFRPTAALAQNPMDFLDQGNGIPNNTTEFKVPLGFINLTNGNLHQEIVFGSFQQRAHTPPVVLKAVYDSRFWQFPPDGSSWWPSFMGKGGWRIVTTADAGLVTYDQQPFPCNDQTADTQMLNFRYIDSEGYTHMFWESSGRGSVNTTVGPNCADNHPDSGYAMDGSGYFIQVTNTVSNGNTYTNAVVYGPDGNQVYPAMEDSNGNFFSYLGAQGSPTTDTLGRTPYTVTTCSDNPNATCYNVPNSSGGTSTYEVTFETINVCTAFNRWGDDYCTVPTTQYGRSVPAHQTFQTIQSIVLPNQTRYTFNYDSGTTSGNYGELTSVTLPTGAAINYTYSTFFDAQGGASDFNPNRWIAGYSTPDGTWTITPQVLASGSTGCPSNLVCNQVTVTKPSSDQEVYTFSSAPEPISTSAFISFYNNTWNTKIQYYNGAATANPVMTAEADYTHPGYDPFPASLTVSMASPGGTLVKQTTYTYKQTGTGPMNAPKTINEYGYGIGAPGPLLRSTVYSYLDETNPAYKNVNIIDRKASEMVIGADGNMKAQTIYTYDSTPVMNDLGGAPQHDSNFSTSYTLRGNLTQIQQWLYPGNVDITTATNYYDDLGNLRQTTDGNNNSTYFDYEDDFPDWSCLIQYSAPQAWVTQTTNALGQNTQSQYFGCTGLPLWHRDQNDINANRVNASYTYDSMNRVTQINYADGGQTTYTYTDTPSYYSPNVLRQDKIASGQQPTASYTMVDGLGRVIRTEHLNGEASPTPPYDMVDTCYDSLGRKSFESYPYQGIGWTPTNYSCSNSVHPGDTFTYDALGRVTQVTNSDGGTVTTDYSQFPVVTVTDQAGKQRRNQTDALGRLIKIWEPDAGGNFSYETDYQYDTLDNLIGVTQQGGDPNSANWRIRSFYYDSLSRLLSATNPESGTITYAYDNANNLTSKTAPAPNQYDPNVTVTTYYSYDTLNRLTAKQYSDSTRAEVYYYDQNPWYNPNYPLWGYVVQNPIGRLVSTYARLNNWTTLDGSSGGGGVGSVLSYDTMGRVIYEHEYNQHVAPWAPDQIFNYTYNLDGSLNTVQYPSGRTVTYAYNQAQRPISAKDLANNINYATGAQYTAAGALSSVVNGSVVNGSTTIFAGITTSNSYNSRMQPVFLTAATPTATIFNLGYDFHLGINDNGNVYAVNNNKVFDHSRDQSFTYDQLNRVTFAQSAATSGPNCWGESYGYDPWANLTSRSVTKCTGEGPLPTANSQNQMSGYGYDAAGNLTEWGFAYNSENQLISAPLANLKFDYDANGRRVQKSNGTLYWYEAGGNVLQETNLSGALKAEYIFFGGNRIARRDPSGTVHYYLADHLGSTDIVASASGAIEEESEYYPFGGERSIIDSGIGNNYKFTGKERDAEDGLDEFGARYFTWFFSRFTTPDWAAKPTNVPYANFGNPQSLNLYSYVENNPTTFGDPDGHECEVCWTIPNFILNHPDMSAAIAGGLAKAGQVLTAVSAAVGRAATTAVAIPIVAGTYLVSPGTGSVNGKNSEVEWELKNQKASMTSGTANPSKPGTLGKPDHQETVKQEAERINGKTEVKIPTPGGSKDSRRADAVGTNPETGAPEIVQVYRPTPAGNIPKREVDAAKDIQNATGIKPSMVPVRPLPKTGAK